MMVLTWCIFRSGNQGSQRYLKETCALAEKENCQFTRESWCSNEIFEECTSLKQEQQVCSGVLLLIFFHKPWKPSADLIIVLTNVPLKVLKPESVVKLQSHIMETYRSSLKWD